MPNQEEIRTQVYEVLESFRKAGQTLGADTQLVADLDLDSVQVLDLLTQVEDQFDISIPLNILPDIRTVDDLCLQAERLIEEAP